MLHTQSVKFFALVLQCPIKCVISSNYTLPLLYTAPLFSFATLTIFILFHPKPLHANYTLSVIFKANIFVVYSLRQKVCIQSGHGNYYQTQWDSVVCKMTKLSWWRGGGRRRWRRGIVGHLCASRTAGYVLNQSLLLVVFREHQWAVEFLVSDLSWVTATKTELLTDPWSENTEQYTVYQTLPRRTKCL